MAVDSKFVAVKNKLKIVNRDVIRYASGLLDGINMEKFDLVITGSSIYNLYHGIHDKLMDSTKDPSDFDFFFSDSAGAENFRLAIGKVPIQVLSSDMNYPTVLQSGITYQSTRAYSFTFPPIYKKVNVVDWPYRPAYPHQNLYKFDFVNYFDFAHTQSVYTPQDNVLQMTPTTRDAIENRKLVANPFLIDRLLFDGANANSIESIGHSMQNLRMWKKRYLKFRARGMTPTDETNDFEAKIAEEMKRLSTLELQLL